MGGGVYIFTITYQNKPLYTSDFECKINGDFDQIEKKLLLKTYK